MTNKQSENLKNGLSIVSICLGIAAVFLWEFSVISILAIIFGIVGLIFNKNKWTPGIGVVLGLIFLLVRISQGHIDRGFSVTQSENNTSVADVPLVLSNLNIPPTASPDDNKEIYSNPDYLKNPSGYLVDTTNKIMSSPYGKTFWVEDATDYGHLKISYVVESNGEQILEVQTIAIPSIGDPANDQSITNGLISSLWKTTSLSRCWNDGAVEFLKANFQGKNLSLFLTNKATNEYALEYTDGQEGEHGEGLLLKDAAYLIISNGYGSLAQPSLAKALGQMRTNTVDNNYNELYSAEGVASLAKKGLWGTCTATNAK